MSNEKKVLVVDSTIESPNGNVNGAVNLVAANGAAIVQPASIAIGTGGVRFFTGTAAGRDAIRAEVGLTPAIGSVYTNTSGEMFVKAANADATADWVKVTTSAAD